MHSRLRLGWRGVALRARAPPSAIPRRWRRRCWCMHPRLRLVAPSPGSSHSPSATVSRRPRVVPFAYRCRWQHLYLGRLQHPQHPSVTQEMQRPCSAKTPQRCSPCPCPCQKTDPHSNPRQGRRHPGSAHCHALDPPPRRNRCRSNSNQGFPASAPLPRRVRRRSRAGLHTRSRYRLPRPRNCRHEHPQRQQPCHRGAEWSGIRTRNSRCIAVERCAESSSAVHPALAPSTTWRPHRPPCPHHLAQVRIF